MRSLRSLSPLVGSSLNCWEVGGMLYGETRLRKWVPGWGCALHLVPHTFLLCFPAAEPRPLLPAPAICGKQSTSHEQKKHLFFTGILS